MRSELVKKLLMSEKYDNLTVKEFASVVRTLEEEIASEMAILSKEGESYEKDYNNEGEVNYETVKYDR